MTTSTTTGKRARRPAAPKKTSTVNKEPPPSRKRPERRKRTASIDDGDFDDGPDNDFDDDALQYAEEELRPGYVYIGKKAVPTRNVGLFQPLPFTAEERVQDLDLPDPVFIYQFLSYFNTLLVGTQNDYNIHMSSFKQSVHDSYGQDDQEYVNRNLKHLENMIGQTLGVGRRFGLLGSPMKELTMQSVHGGGVSVHAGWVPDIPDHEVLSGLVYAMADGSGIVDMDSTKPWKHWQKMRLVDFAGVAQRVMECLKRQYAGYPPNHRINNFTFTERYNLILDLMRTCKGSVVRMHRPSTLEELLLNPKKMKQRFLDNQVNNLKKKMDASELKLLRAKDDVVEWDKGRIAAIEAGEPEPPLPESPSFRAAYSEWLIEQNKIAAGVLPAADEAGCGESALPDFPQDDFPLDGILDEEEESDNPYSDSEDENAGRRKRKKPFKPLTAAQRTARSRIAEARRRNVPLRRIPKEKAPMHKAPLSRKDLQDLQWDQNPTLLKALARKEAEVNQHWDDLARRDAQDPVVRKLPDGRLIGEMPVQDYSQHHQVDMNHQYQHPQQPQFAHWHGEQRHDLNQQQPMDPILQQQLHGSTDLSPLLGYPGFDFQQTQQLQQQDQQHQSQRQVPELFPLQTDLPSSQEQIQMGLFASPTAQVDSGITMDYDATIGQFEVAWEEMQRGRTGSFVGVEDESKAEC